MARSELGAISVVVFEEVAAVPGQCDADCTDPKKTYQPMVVSTNTPMQCPGWRL